jgi:hypothetical protein
MRNPCGETDDALPPIKRISYSKQTHATAATKRRQPRHNFGVPSWGYTRGSCHPCLDVRAREAIYICGATVFAMQPVEESNAAPTAVPFGRSSLSTREHGNSLHSAFVSIASPASSPLTTPSSSPGSCLPAPEPDGLSPSASVLAASIHGTPSFSSENLVPAPLTLATTACPWCTRTSKHQCLRAASLAALKVFSAAYGLKAVISLLFTLLKRRFTLKALGSALLSSDSLRFGAFLGSLCGLVRAIRCLLARYRGVDDKWNAAISGALSSVSIALDSPQRQWAIASYMACRAVYSFTQYVKFAVIASYALCCYTLLLLQYCNAHWRAASNPSFQPFAVRDICCWYIVRVSI